MIDFPIKYVFIVLDRLTSIKVQEPDLISYALGLLLKLYDHSSDLEFFTRWHLIQLTSQQTSVLALNMLRICMYHTIVFTLLRPWLTLQLRYFSSTRT